MKAAVMRANNAPLTIEEVHIDDPGPGEVLVKTAASGICHSDLHVIEGSLPVPPPCILGHEGAGIVEEVGKGVTHLKAGDHVVLAWVQPCGRCHFCVNAKPHLCEAGLQLAMAGEDFVFEKDGMPIGRMAGVGSFADHTVVKASAAIKIRDDMPLDKACLVGCGVMTGVGAAINTAKVKPGDTVAVFGAGGVGLNVIQGAALSGAARIIAVDLVDAKLKLAKVFGATDVVNGKDTDAAMAIRELTDGLGVDYAFEVIGAAAVVSQAYMSLKRGGLVVVVGVPAMGTDLTIPGFSLTLEEKGVVGSLYGSGNLHRDMVKLVDLYMNKKLKIDELISRKIKLEDVNTAFTAMEKGEVARSVIVY